MTNSAFLLTVPASSERLRILRTTVASVAAATGMTLDQVDDVRLAVEEAAAVLLGGFPEQIQVRIEEIASPLRISVTARTTEQINTSERSFSWTILHALTDDTTLSVLGDDDGTSSAEITLRFHPAPLSTRAGS